MLTGLLWGLVLYVQPATFDQRFYFQIHPTPYCWAYDAGRDCKDRI